MADSARVPDVVEPPPPPPTGEELLRQAGYNAVDAQNLSDFEDDIDAHGEPDPDHPQPQGTVFNGNSSFYSSGANGDSAAVEQSITQRRSGTPVPGGVADVDHLWTSWFGKRDDIAQKEEPAEENAEVPTSGDSTGHLFLSLDYSISVPFYKNEHAPTILQTFRLEDSTARLVLDPAADNSHHQHFARFCSRLHAGELFVEMIGVKLLAMYSSENRALGERLGAPSNLLGLSDSVLVAQVAIENQSGYVDAVAYADNTQWSTSV
ncbi:uncharacterized protein B0H18DRAFT_1114848 [Fomitopsis serialis]|uniref:uncharacterized protein n=1 Tax=Fomitopsis serialis TaxID=139415 RepID=UPI002007D540|nr:uncharacterized protein B0H18DRAFT_1114848 [Neoantrodia serialis]KAH9935031.1 hypothetical protein B0H18DRAFT_1114848 [Neoantrodia serialis]